MQASEVLRYVEMRQNRELRWSFPNMVGFALLNSETGELPVADIYSFIVLVFIHLDLRFNYKILNYAIFRILGLEMLFIND